MTSESPRFECDTLPAVFQLLTQVAEAVVATAGSDCEVVVHDLRQPEHSVVALYGTLTRRSVGAPISDPELLAGNVDRFTESQLLYRTTTPFGKELLSSTVWVRDETGHIVGALCINMDFENLRMARDILERDIQWVRSLLNRSIVELPDPEAEAEPKSLLTFATSPEDFAQIALQGALRDIGKPAHQLTREDKVAIVRELDRAGVFSLRGAAETVAGQLGVSRASVYSYLNASRAEPAVAVSE